MVVNSSNSVAGRNSLVAGNGVGAAQMRLSGAF